MSAWARQPWGPALAVRKPVNATISRRAG